MADDLRQTMLNSVYKALMRHIHPDKAKPGDRERHTRLSQRINAAYAAGDLEELNTIFYEVTGTTGGARPHAEPSPPPRSPDSGPVRDRPAAGEQNAAAGSGWDEVARLAGKAVAAFVEARQARRAAEAGAPRSHSPGGSWRTANGFQAHITERKKKLTVQIIDPFGMLVSIGVGRMNGDRVELQIRQFNGYFYEQARAMLQMSPDGRHLRGTIHAERSGLAPVLLERQW